jgi:DNA-directed RNA polymerase subunit L
MEIKILEKSKDEIKLEIENLTIAELLRTYLNKNSSVTFAAWKREHITKNPILLVKTKSKDSKKVVNDTIKAIEKDLSVTSKEFSKLK